MPGRRQRLIAQKSLVTQLRNIARATLNLERAGTKPDLLVVHRRITQRLITPLALTSELPRGGQQNVPLPIMVADSGASDEIPQLVVFSSYDTEGWLEGDYVLVFIASSWGDGFINDNPDPDLSLTSADADITTLYGQTTHDFMNDPGPGFEQQIWFTKIAAYIVHVTANAPTFNRDITNGEPFQAVAVTIARYADQDVGIVSTISEYTYIPYTENWPIDRPPPTDASQMYPFAVAEDQAGLITVGGPQVEFPDGFYKPGGVPFPYLAWFGPNQGPLAEFTLDGFGQAEDWDMFVFGFVVQALPGAFP